jgi:hypothetical protein
MAQWRCRINGRETGPFGDDELRAKAAAGEIKPTDQIYNPASSRWEPASRLRGLFAPPAVAPQAVDDRGLPPALRLVADDVGPFLKVAGSYSFSATDQWSGAVYASPVAFYLVKGLKQSAGRQFGIIGMALAAAMDKPDDLRSCRLSELPEAVREQLQTWTKRDFDVIVLPKAAIHRVSTTWYGRIRIDCGENRFNLTSTVFTAGRNRRFLRENGWRLNQEMEVTSAPVHGVAVGRGGDDPGPAQPNLFQRLAYVIIFILAAIAGIVLKANRPPSPSQGYVEPARAVPEPYGGSRQPSPVRHP